MQSTRRSIGFRGKRRALSFHCLQGTDPQSFTFLNSCRDLLDVAPVLKLPVHPGDGLEQVVMLDRLVDVDGVEEGHVKAGQPHVHHDDDF